MTGLCRSATINPEILMAATWKRAFKFEAWMRTKVPFAVIFAEAMGCKRNSAQHPSRAMCYAEYRRK